MAKKAKKANAAASSGSEGPRTVELVLSHKMALGEGTRERGTVIATAHSDGGSGYLPETIAPAEGIHERELKHALGNHHLLHVR